MGRQELKVEGEHEKVREQKNFRIILLPLYRYLKMLFIDRSICKPVSKSIILGDALIDANFTGKPVILLKNGYNRGSISLQRTNVIKGWIPAEKNVY